ncbi:MAG: RNA 2',3'-cyclic phosphodiesterase [Sphingobacteriia bacterium]|nr:RNA 2',3'-cyclic phosphodiesterase [Sphingobacteriia bacterium]
MVVEQSNDQDALASVETLAALLRTHGLRLAVAESCTGGWLAKVLTDLPGSSDWLDRGFVTYSNAAKQSMLGVRGTTLAAHGAVSEAVVAEMARGVLSRAGVEVAVAISGVAGPGGGSPEKPVGTVCLAWAWPGGLETERLHFAGDREAVRRQSVQAALAGLISRLRASADQAVLPSAEGQGARALDAPPDAGWRWFFAIWPDAPASTALAASASGLIPPGARPTHVADLHLTLAFLGPLAPARLQCIEQAAGEIRCAPFEIAIETLDRFAHARVLWCGPALTPRPLTTLVERLRTALVPCGLVADPRPYRPHITLARRVMTAPPAQAWPGEVRWVAHEFVLAAGQGGPGPRYRIHRRWPLRAV